MTSLLARTTLTAMTTAFVVVVAVTPGVSDARNASTDSPGNVSGVDSDDSTPAGPESGPAGPFCASIPPEGEGSFEGMADDPVATAASNNPYLTTLTSAVQAAGLVDTLNGEGPFTVFAPNNEAFAAIPPADLDAILADTEWLTEILLYHVVSGQSLSAVDLAAAGSVQTAQGEELTFTTEADGSISINGGAATLTCSDITTQNATGTSSTRCSSPPHLSDTR